MPPLVIMKLAMPVSPCPTFPRKRWEGGKRKAIFTLKRVFDPTDYSALQLDIEAGQEHRVAVFDAAADVAAVFVL